MKTMVNMTVKKITTAGLLAASLGLVACAEKIPPEDKVKERAEARWAIRVAGGIDGLYEFLSPAKRQTISRAIYERGIGIKLKYTEAKVSSVACDEKVQFCTVKIKVLYKHQGGNGGRVLEETWTNEEGEWWYIPN